jgi:methionine synthase I (cobalamin-dependent)
VVQPVHEAYIRAGAEVIIANTFGSSRAALEPAGLGSRVAEANRNAVRAALRAREAATSETYMIRRRARTHQQRDSALLLRTA